MDPSFTDHEKRYVLAEMIKASQIDIGAVVGFIKSCDILPDWMEMQYPLGRTPNQCRQAAESMGITAPQIPPQIQPPPASQQHQPYHQLPPLQQPQQLFQPQPLPQGPPAKRKSLSEQSEPVPKRLAVAPVEPQPITYVRAVNIQPRPSANGYVAALPVPSTSISPPPRNPRKRGRPSKADREAQARASGSIGFPHARLAPAPKPATAPTAESSPMTPVVSRELSPWEPIGANVKRRGRPSSAHKLQLASDETEEEQSPRLSSYIPRTSLQDPHVPPKSVIPTPLKAEEPPQSPMPQGIPASDVPSGERQVSRSRVDVADLIKTGLQSPKTAKV